MNGKLGNVPTATVGGTSGAAIRPVTPAASGAMSIRSLSNRGNSRLPPIANKKALATGAENPLPTQSASTAAGGGTVGEEPAPPTTSGIENAAPKTSTAAPAAPKTSTTAPAAPKTSTTAPAAPNYKVLRQIAGINSKLQKFKTDSDMSELTELSNAIAREFTKTMGLRSDLQNLMKHYGFSNNQMEKLIDASYLKSEPYTKFRKEMIEKNNE